MAKKFEPAWREVPPVKGTAREIFKWGDPEEYKHPNKRLFAMIKETFKLTDDDFRQPRDTGDTPIALPKKPKITDKHIKKFESICGRENVALDDFSRLKYSTGKTMEEAIQLRTRGFIDAVTDVVLHPRNRNEIEKIIVYCRQNKIPITVYGGGSSVTLGLNAPKGGVTLVMQTWMNRLINFNETDQTVTVEAGMMGPVLELLLNEAPERLGTTRRFTCGHFPQSFEFSSVGGWIVTLGSGQQSSYYGDAADLVISQDYLTPAGLISTKYYPVAANGPDINSLFMGSEGSFGILVQVTLKVFRFLPENRKKFSFMFPTWHDAVNAAREITQCEEGMPSVFRISDPEETDVAMKLYGIEGTPIDSLIRFRGFRPMERSLFIGQADGGSSYTRNVLKSAQKIAKKHKGLWLTGFPVTSWEHGRFRDPYMREDLSDYGITIDTLETSVSWSNLHHVHEKVRLQVKKRKDVICMTHSSHFYPQGTNLYFIFIGKYKNLADYTKFQASVIDAIEKSGGSLSHHHGVGKMMAPWMQRHLGKNSMDLLGALKDYCDPTNIMNPGGTLGFDLPSSRKK